MMVMEREMEEEREGGSSTSFSKEVPPIWRLHQSGFRRVIIWANYLSLPIGEVGESEGPTLYVPRPSKLKKKEIILAGGAGGGWRSWDGEDLESSLQLTPSWRVTMMLEGRQGDELGR